MLWLTISICKKVIVLRKSAKMCYGQGFDWA